MGDDGPTATAVEEGVAGEAAKMWEGVEVGSDDVCIGDEGFDMRKEAGMWMGWRKVGRRFEKMASVWHPLQIFKIQICTPFDPLDLLG